MLGVGWVVLGRLSFPDARRQDHHSVRHARRHHPGLGLRDLPALAEVLIEGSSTWNHLDFERLLERLAEEPFHLLLTLLDVRLQGGNHVLVLFRMHDAQLRTRRRLGLPGSVVPWLVSHARSRARKSYGGDNEHEQPATQTVHFASLPNANPRAAMFACSRRMTKLTSRGRCVTLGLRKNCEAARPAAVLRSALSTGLASCVPADSQMIGLCQQWAYGLK